MPILDVAFKSMRAAGIRHLVTVANFETEGLRKRFENDPDCQVTAACREGEAIAIACGLIAAGVPTVLSMENLGLFECLDTLRGMACVMEVPLPIFVGYLGHGISLEDAKKMVGGFFGQLTTSGAWTEPVVAGTGVPHRLLSANASDETTAKVLSEALGAKEPFIVIVDHLNEEKAQ